MSEETSSMRENESIITSESSINPDLHGTPPRVFEHGQSGNNPEKRMDKDSLHEYRPLTEEEIKEAQKKLENDAKDVRIPESGINSPQNQVTDSEKDKNTFKVTGEDDIVDGDSLIIEDSNGGSGGGSSDKENEYANGESLIAKLIRGNIDVKGIGSLNSASLDWFTQNQDDVLNHPDKFGLTVEDQQAFFSAWNRKIKESDQKASQKNNASKRSSSSSPNFSSDTPLPGFVPFDADDDWTGDRKNAYQHKNTSGGVDSQNRQENRRDIGVPVDETLKSRDKGEHLSAIQALLSKVEITERSYIQQPQEIKTQIDFLKQSWAEMMADPENAEIDPVALWQGVSRLRVHELYVSLKNLNIYSDEAKKNIESQLAQIPTSDIPGGIDCAVLIKGKIESLGDTDENPFEGLKFMEGLPVGDMMMKLQETAVFGLDGRKWNGNERTLSAPDLQRIKTKLKKGIEGDSESAYRLASRLFFILGEVGVLDIPVINEEGKVTKAPEGPLGKMAYFEESRLAALGKRESADDVGPWLTVNLLPVLCSSAIRMATYTENGNPDKRIHLANEDKWAIINDKSVEPVRRKNLLKEVYIYDPLLKNHQLLDYTKLAYEKLPNGFLESHWKRTIPTRLKVREWYLDTEIKASGQGGLTDTNQNENYRTTLAQIDGALQPRQTLLYGIITQAAINMHGKSDTKDTIFDYETWFKVKRTWTEGPSAVMTPDMWDAVEDVCKNPPSYATSYKTDPAITRRLFVSEFLARVIPTSR